MGPAVLIVIVNYRTSGLAIDCLHSTVKEAIDSPGLRVVVDDNHSGDGSVEKLQADCCWGADRLIWTLQKLSGLVACRDDDLQGFASDLPGGEWELIRTGRRRAIAEGQPILSGSDREERRRA